MAWPRKGTTQIEVNKEMYNWRVAQRDQTLRVLVQLSTAPGRLLQFSVPFTDPWLRFSWQQVSGETLPENSIEFISPSFVKQVIEFGLANSWMTGHKGQLYKLTLEEGKLKRITN